MKRRFFAVFVVLLALMLATCDLFEEPQATGSNLVSPDGQPMVRLTIKVSGGRSTTSRSLTTEQAQDIVDLPATTGYYEVVFYHGGTLYEARWSNSDGETMITIPVGDYTSVHGGKANAVGPNDGAVLFAGDNTSKTLLAIGTIKNCYEDEDGLLPPNSPPGNITSDTELVVFELTALENDVNTTPSSSTFKIIGPTEFVDTGKTYTYETAKIAGSIPETDETPSYPIFSIPEGGFNNEDSAITNLEGNIVASYYIFNPYFAGVYLDTTTPFAVPYNYTDDTYSSALPSLISLTPASSILVDPTGGDFRFLIDVSAGTLANEVGLSKVCIEATVHAYGIAAVGYDGETPTTTIPWKIKGGMNNANPDGGPVHASPWSDGGAVILGIGTHAPTVSTKKVKIENPGWKQP